MSTNKLNKWLLEQLANQEMTTAELEKAAAGTYKFGEILTQLNRLKAQKKLITTGDLPPLRWKVE